jgi:hypothetical protein
MVVGLGVDLFTIAPMEAEFRNADPVFTGQLFTHNEIVAHARGVALASVAPESSL